MSQGTNPTLRRVLEVLGWIFVVVLVGTGLSVIWRRTDFLSSAYALQAADPMEAFGPFDARYWNHRIATILHLIPALIIVLLGPLQFIRKIRNGWPKAHRIVGALFLISGVISALSGVVIGVFDPFGGLVGQGFNEAMATLFFSIMVLVCLVMAFIRIKARRIAEHREWMIRGFALLMGVTTERLLLQSLMTTDIPFQEVFGATFWMATIFNLAAAQIWISLTRTGSATHWKDLAEREKNAAPAS